MPSVTDITNTISTSLPTVVKMYICLSCTRPLWDVDQCSQNKDSNILTAGAVQFTVNVNEKSLLANEYAIRYFTTQDSALECDTAHDFATYSNATKR